MKIRILLISLILSFSNASQAIQTEIDLLNQLPAKLVKLPANLGHFTKAGTKEFEDKRYGSVAVYKSQGNKNTINASIFIYNTENSKIETGVSKVILNELDAAISSIKEFKGYQGFRELENGSASVDGQEVVYAVHEYKLKAANSEELMTMTSYTLLTGIKGHIVKIRLSESDPNIDENTVKQIIEQVIKNLKK